VREDVYCNGAIVAHKWHNAPDDTLPEAVREEALAILTAPSGEQMELKLW
jgi:hypothetical protein